VGIVSDFVFGLSFTGGARRHFVVEIDRGTMPVVRSERKSCARMPPSGTSGSSVGDISRAHRDY
jgi:hypothetical protein